MKAHRRLLTAVALACLGTMLPASVLAAPLGAIRERGTFNVCAHPDGLPYSSQDRTWPGFQLEIGEAVARRLGVKLHVDWIVYTRHARRLDCDAIMGSVVKLEPGEPGPRRGQRPSKPYAAGGYVLVVPAAAAVQRLEDVRNGKVGVEHASWPHYVLDTRRVPVSSFGGPLDILEAVASGAVAAGLVSDAHAGWYAKLNPGRVRIAAPPEPARDFQWNVAVGLRGADAALVDAVNRALETLVADGTIAVILSRYGIQHRPPVAP